MSWDTDNDVLLTLFRPGCDKATDLANMVKRAADYIIEEGVKSRGWKELK